MANYQPSGAYGSTSDGYRRCHLLRRAIEDVERAGRALRTLGTPLVELVAPTRYVDHQASINDTVPQGWRYYWEGASLGALSDDVSDILARYRLRRHLAEVVRSDLPPGGAAERPWQCAHYNKDIQPHTSVH